jgi:hypothetical protein
MKTLLWIVGLLVASAPVVFLVTFLTSPLWSWVEARYGIESIGHSGPADWCFELVYVLLVAVSLAGYWLMRRLAR